MPAPAHLLLMAGGDSAKPSFTDDFNRSNRNLNGDNGWTVDVSPGSINIVSNVATGVSSATGWAQNSTAIVTTGTYYSEIDVLGGLSGGIAGVFVRYINQNTFYIGRVHSLSGDTYELYKRNSGTYTLLASLSQTFPSTPFRIRCQVDSSDLVALQLWNGSSWVTKCSATDNSIGGGTPGFFLQTVTTTPSMDNFKCGDL